MTQKTQAEKHMASLNESDAELIKSVANRMNLVVEDVISLSRKEEFVNARKVLSLIFYNRGYTLVRIADIIRVKTMNHTSIVNLLKKAKYHYATELNFSQIVDDELSKDDIKRRQSTNSEYKSEIEDLKKNVMQMNNLTKLILNNMQNLGIWEYVKEAQNKK